MLTSIPNLYTHTNGLQNEKKNSFRMFVSRNKTKKTATKIKVFYKRIEMNYFIYSFMSRPLKCDSRKQKKIGIK